MAIGKYYYALLLQLTFSPLLSGLPVEEQTLPTTLKELVEMLKAEELTPTSPLPQEYASYLLSGDWKNPELKHVPDNILETQPTGEEVRKQLAEILLAARKKKKEEKNEATLPLIDLFPEANIKIAGLTTTTAPSTNQATEGLTTAATQEEISTTSEAEDNTTTEGPSTTTTENPADLPKTGDLELLVADVTYWGNMLHWSTNGQYLAIADIWGQRYLRYAEIPEATTTVPTTTEVVTTVATTVQATTQADTSTEAGTSQSEDTTQEEGLSTESGEVLEARTNPTTSITTVQPDTTTTIEDNITIPNETTTTETPTTTAEPLPYTLHSMSVSIETVFMLRPQGRAEGAFPLLMPVFDPAAPLDTDKVVMAYSERLHIVEWDLNATETSWLSPEIWLNSASGRVATSAFMVPSPAWVDPAGRMVVSTHDFRPFQKVVTESTFTVIPNNFDELDTSFAELSRVSCDPVGMAWSIDNATVFLSDAHSRNVTKCSYSMEYIRGVQNEMDATNCSTLVHLPETDMADEARPKGLAMDSSGHLWLAVEHNGERSAILEINPDTGSVVSTIDTEDADLVDLVFGGEDLDHLLLLSKKHLYKLTGLGVRGHPVPDFIWIPEER